MWGDTKATKSGVVRLVNVASKERRIDKGQKPYATITDPYTGWKYHILKSWQADNSKVGARWFVRVEGDFDEMGDEPCSSVRPSLLRATQVRDCEAKGLVWFDETVWESIGNFCAWAWGEQ